jgi:hypothetical protein
MNEIPFTFITRKISKGRANKNVIGSPLSVRARKTQNEKPTELRWRTPVRAGTENTLYTE